jgi:hypothetical protein
MTMTQFALVAAVSFPSQLRREFKREIPFLLHAFTVALFLYTFITTLSHDTPLPSHRRIFLSHRGSALTPSQIFFPHFHTSSPNVSRWHAACNPLAQCSHLQEKVRPRLPQLRIFRNFLRLIFWHFST